MEDLPLYARLGRAAAAAPRPKKRAAPTGAEAPAASSRKKTKGPSKKGASSVEVPALERQETSAEVVPPPAVEPESPVRREASASAEGSEALAVELPHPEPDLPSSSSLPSPPPLQKPLLSRGRLWQEGVIPEVSTAFLPPLHFTSCAALSQPALDELHRNQTELCRAIGYNQALISIRGLYTRAQADAQRFKAQVAELAQRLAAAEAQAASANELREELQVAEAKATSAGEELSKSWAERDAAVSALEVVRVELAATQTERDAAKAAALKADQELQQVRENCARAEKGAADGVAAVKSLQQQRSSLQEKVADLQKALEAERDGRQEAADALVEAASECFEQALAQIRYFNPGVELKVDGYDYRAFVKADGTLIPYQPPAAAEKDASEAGDPAAAEDPPSA